MVLSDYNKKVLQILSINLIKTLRIYKIFVPEDIPRKNLAKTDWPPRTVSGQPIPCFIYFKICHFTSMLAINAINPINYASSIAFPMSWRIYLLANCTQSVALYAFARASFRSAPFAVMPNTRPPFVTIFSSFKAVPAWKQ